MRNFGFALSLGLFVAATASGCGGSGSGGDGFSSGVTPTKTGDELTPAETEQLCEAAGKHIEKELAKADPCRMAGALAAGFAMAFDESITDGMLREVCSAAVESCRESDDQDVDPIEEDPAEDCSSMELPAECKATVSEIEACIGDAGKLITSMFNRFPACDSLTREQLEGLDGEGEELENPKSCDTVEAKCPGLFDDTGLDDLTADASDDFDSFDDDDASDDFDTP